MFDVLIDLTGQRFGKWLVLSRVSNDKYRNPRWFCRCDCGREKIVQGNNLRSGKSKGCRSCHISNINTTHGQTGTRLYGIWKGMIARCEYSNHRDYKYYGGRGIGMCREWKRDFAVFSVWSLANGYKKGLTIDRIDNGKGYSPDNCQWLTRSENSLKAWYVDDSYEKVTPKRAQEIKEQRDSGIISIPSKSLPGKRHNYTPINGLPPL